METSTGRISRPGDQCCRVQDRWTLESKLGWAVCRNKGGESSSLKSTVLPSRKGQLGGGFFSFP